MHLSRKGWNNVLIFSVLLIIFVFNFSQKLTLSPKVHQRSVIPESVTIVEIKTPDYQITRLGRSWQSEPTLGLSEQQLNTVVDNWQHLKLTTQDPVSENAAPYTIQVYIADQDQPIIVQLYQYGENYLLQTDSDMSLLLEANQLPLLLGR
ncbi:hypothetical protein ACR30L_00470 [Psychromonas sp. PT13]|uniref:hypothetical protein n=1 Tax=Psychromonas sp. PT13 TaxID=3439547 RepID=UPI003EB955AE